MYELVVIFCAKYLFLLPVVLLVAYFFYTDNKKEFALVALGTLALAFVLGKGAGLLFYNPLPFVVEGFTPLFPHAANNGFPSDHTLLAGAIAALFWFFNKRISAALVAVALLVGAARMLAGVHHFVDIAAALLIAALAAFIAYSLRSAILKPRSH